MVCKLLQDAPRQHPGSGNSVRRGARTGIRGRNADARSAIRSPDWAHFRQACGRSPTGGIDAAQPMALGASGPHGRWMALAREDMAASLFRSHEASTQLPADNAVGRRTRGAAATVRSQSLAAPAAIAAHAAPRGCRSMGEDGPALPRPLGGHLSQDELRAEHGSRSGLDPLCDGHRGDRRGERRASQALPRARIIVTTWGRTSPDTLPDAPRLRFSLARGRERRTWR